MNIQPESQSINKVFGTTTYYIDFYQRDYKWNETQVNTLLDDVFYKFAQEYDKYGKTIEAKSAPSHYSWYYLNTYVTNTINGKTYIVDGQQRLTTITIILIALKQLCFKIGSKLEKWVEDKICGHDGEDNIFWMYHEKHISALKGIYSEHENIDLSSGDTAKNIVGNYQIIRKYIFDYFQNIEIHKIESFIYFFIHRLVLVQLVVEQTDVPMLFEVINDRGKRLKSYEILKGKLLGQIHKDELFSLGYNDLWESQTRELNKFWVGVEEDGNEMIDEFFIDYLKAKNANSIGESRNFNKDYHRVMFTNKSPKTMDLKHNPSQVKYFLSNEFKYFSSLYARILETDINEDANYPYVGYNSLNEQDLMYRLILSSCVCGDSEEELKIKVISKEFDRLFSLLSIQNAYDNNIFQIEIHELVAEIREMPSSELRVVFDNRLIKILRTKKSNSSISVPFSYQYFENIGYGTLNQRFIRYFFARIEKLIAEKTSNNLPVNFSDLVIKTGYKYGFHIEHILAWNEENLALFETEEEFDFQRNRLGGLLLLRGRDNISSNDDSFKDKLSAYSGTLRWNESLRSDFYENNLNFRDFINENNLKFKSYSTFTKNSVEERHKLLFEICKIIWEC